MSKELDNLEQLLGQMIDEHRKLLKHVDAQQAAMKAFKIDVVEDTTHLQEATRLRIANLDNRRRTLTVQIAKAIRSNDELTLTRLAELFPPHAKQLTKLRDDLRNVVMQIQQRTTVGGKLGGAILGHLNTALRILVSAVQQAGVYTKQGTPKVAGRIGTMDAVG